MPPVWKNANRKPIWKFTKFLQFYFSPSDNVYCHFIRRQQFLIWFSTNPFDWIVFLYYIRVWKRNDWWRNSLQNTRCSYYNNETTHRAIFQGTVFEYSSYFRLSIIITDARVPVHIDIMFGHSSSLLFSWIIVNRANNAQIHLKGASKTFTSLVAIGHSARNMN